MYIVMYTLIALLFNIFSTCYEAYFSATLEATSSQYHNYIRFPLSSLRVIWRSTLLRCQRRVCWIACAVSSNLYLTAGLARHGWTREQIQSGKRAINIFHSREFYIERCRRRCNEGCRITRLQDIFAHISWIGDSYRALVWSLDRAFLHSFANLSLRLSLGWCI